jgi:hypothetical protein
MRIHGRLIEEGSTAILPTLAMLQRSMWIWREFIVWMVEKARHAIAKDTFHKKLNEIPSVYRCNLKEQYLSTEHGNIKVYANGNI